MTDFLLFENTVGSCPHQGTISFQTTNRKVLVNNKPLVTLSDPFLITGCTFYRGDSYHPCIFVRWQTYSSNIFVSGVPVIVKENFGQCTSADQSPQGKANITFTQKKVRGG